MPRKLGIYTLMEIHYVILFNNMERNISINFNKK